MNKTTPLLLFAGGAVALALITTAWSIIGWLVGLVLGCLLSSAARVQSIPLPVLPMQLPQWTYISTSALLLLTTAFAAGGALAYPVHNLGPNGNGCDEAKIGQLARVPETLVDLVIISVNAVGAFWVWQRLGLHVDTTHLMPKISG
jgi:hypothetical protein